MFARGVAGDLTGVNSVVEAGFGYDISNAQELDAWQRSQRGAAGIASLASTFAAGLSIARAVSVLRPLPNVRSLSRMHQVTSPLAVGVVLVSNLATG